MAIPATIAGIAEPILSITDTAIVGNIPVDGVEALAAVGIVGAFLSMLIWILGQTRSAISAIISQYLGAGKLEEVKSLPAQAIILNVALSILILISTIFFVEEIFWVMNARGKILEFCVSYYSIRVWGFPLTLFVFAVMGIFRGLQNTVWPMVIAVTGAVLNIILDFILVYGIDGYLEPLYLEGAAWASLIAQGVMAVMALVLLVKKTQISLIPHRKLNKEIGRLIGMSLNLFLRTVALNITLVLAVREAARIGEASIGAHTIAINLWLLAAFFIDGYGAAGNILGGKLLGAKSYDGLWKLAKQIVLYGSGVGLVLIAVGVIFYEPLGKIFTSDPYVLAAFYSIFVIVILGMPINSVAFTLDGLFKGLGEMKFLRNVLLSATFLVFIPLLYCSKYFGWGLYGIWIAITAWMAVRAGMLIYKFRRKFRPLLQKSYL